MHLAKKKKKKKLASTKRRKIPVQNCNSVIVSLKGASEYVSIESRAFMFENKMNLEVCLCYQGSVV